MPENETHRSRAYVYPLTITLVVGIYMVLVAWRAWVGDDAYITLRTVHNFVNGYGLTWNPPERVQTFTHPLWMLLLSAFYAVPSALSPHSVVLFYVTIAAGLLCSLASVITLTTKIAPNALAACLGMSCLITSQAFLDYSTSGLENPLTHFLLGLCAWVVLRHAESRQTLFVLSLLCALCMVNRLDVGLLTLPAVLHSWMREGWRRGGAVVLVGFSPLFLWEIFSIFYYGLPFPNTAYAKLGAGIERLELIGQGLNYAANSLKADPVTLSVIAVGASLGLAHRGRRRASLAIGVLLYVLYVVAIGGDFMSGRFFTPPLLVATVLLVDTPLPARLSYGLIGALAASWLTLTTYNHHVPRYRGGDWHRFIDDHGIADERASYGTAVSLRGSLGQLVWPRPAKKREADQLRSTWATEDFGPLHSHGLVGNNWPPGSRVHARGHLYHPVVIRGAVGILGYYLGPDVHVLDYHAICDPLLARLPAVRPDPLLAAAIPRMEAKGWRVGHYLRAIPDGYPETLSTGRMVIRDEHLREFYEKLYLITRGPLLDDQRLAAIWALNLGKYDYLLDDYIETGLLLRNE